ncbi:hypothetical protein M0R45_016220 [Rubus argutus]|uniref:Uncharacterized protein n=1 Tax=Rubus argutus TaxID=59490 RepID=A0AAW1XRB2_RUBAR
MNFTADTVNHSTSAAIDAGNRYTSRTAPTPPLHHRSPPSPISYAVILVRSTQPWSSCASRAPMSQNPGRHYHRLVPPSLTDDPPLHWEAPHQSMMLPAPVHHSKQPTSPTLLCFQPSHRSLSLLRREKHGQREKTKMKQRR